MTPLTEIRTRRAHLMARAAVERERFSLQIKVWEAPLALLDKSVAAAGYVRRHPQWMIAAVLLLAILRPKRAISWARNGLIAWRSWRWISETLRNLALRRPA